MLAHMPSAALSFWRWTGAFFVAFPFAWRYLKQDWPALWAHWKIMLVLAATGIALFNITAYIGLSGTTALNVLLLQSSMPLVVTVCAFILFGEKPSGRQLTAIMISLAGVAYIATHGSLDALIGLGFYQADLWILASIVIYAVYTVLLRRRPKVHPLSFMQAAMGLGLLIVAPFYVWEGGDAPAVDHDSWSIAGIGYMAVFPSFIAYLLFNRGVQLVGAVRAGQFTHLIPIFGSVMACLWLGETFETYHVAGIALIGSGIAIARPKIR
jgi:drug/metabolite transporter (DMT)-like permease